MTNKPVSIFMVLRPTFLLLLALLACTCAAQVTTNTLPLGTTGSAVITYNWTADGAGNVPLTGAPLGNQFQGYFVTQAETVPRSPAPLAGYSVAITDNAGIDFLGGSGSNLSATLPQGFATACTAPPINGTVNLAISGQTNGGARGVVYVFLQQQCIPGSGSSATIGVSAGVPANPCSAAGLLDVNQSNGALYSCPTAGGSWVLTGGGGTWGSITGTLSSQTDLQTALNTKWTSAQTTPTCTAGAQNLLTTANTNLSFGCTLTGNVTFSFSPGAPTAGSHLHFAFTQDATGFRGCTMPSGFSTSFDCSKVGPNVTIVEDFTWNGSSAELSPVQVYPGPGVCIETAAPVGNPPAGVIWTWCDSTDHQFETKNSSGTVSKLGSGSGFNPADYTSVYFRDGISTGAAGTCNGSYWSFAGANTGGQTFTSQLVDLNHWPVCRGTTGAVNNNDLAIYLVANSAPTDQLIPSLGTLSGSQAWENIVNVRLPAITTLTAKVCMNDSHAQTDDTSTNSMCVRFSTNAGDSTWKLITSSGGSNTVVDSTVTVVAATWYRLRLYSTVSGTIKLDVQPGGGSVTTVQSTTNITASNLVPAITLRTRGASTASIDVAGPIVFDITGITRP